MVQIKDNYLWRGGDRIGKIVDNGIYDHADKHLGYFRDNHVYDHENREVAWIEGNKIKFPNDSHMLRLEDVQEKIVGGPFSDLARVAIKMFLGD